MLKERVESLCTANIDLKSQNEELKTKLDDLQAQIEDLKKKFQADRYLMLVRQMATSFQAKSVMYTGISHRKFPYSVTPKDLVAKVDKESKDDISIRHKYDALWEKIQNFGYDGDEDDFNASVKLIRGLGTGNSHPDVLVVDGVEEKVTVEIMEQVKYRFLFVSKQCSFVFKHCFPCLNCAYYVFLLTRPLPFTCM